MERALRVQTVEAGESGGWERIFGGGRLSTPARSWGGGMRATVGTGDGAGWWGGACASAIQPLCLPATGKFPSDLVPENNRMAWARVGGRGVCVCVCLCVSHTVKVAPLGEEAGKGGGLIGPAPL